MNEPQQICRFCLNILIKSPGSTSVEDEIFRNKLTAVSYIRFTNDKQLPTEVCTECTQKVEDFFIFMETVRCNQQKLESGEVVAQPLELQIKTEPMENEIFLNDWKEDAGFDMVNKIEIMDTDIQDYENDANHDQQQIQIDEELDSLLFEEQTKALTNEPQLGFTEVQFPEDNSTNEQDRDPRKERKAKMAEEDRLIGSHFTLKCDTCSESFETWKALTRHTKKDHNQEAVVHCCSCLKSLSRKAALLIHINSHIKPFKCNACGKGFSSKQSLDSHHTKTHTPESLEEHSPNIHKRPSAEDSTMPTSSKIRKVEPKRYSSSHLENILSSIRNGFMTVNYASKHYGIPRGTIQYRLSNRYKNKGTTGPYTVLTTKEEEDIISFLKEMEKKGFPITRNSFVRKISSFLKENPRVTPFKNNIPVDEGITDFDTFLDLNNAEFSQLRLKTKVINTIQRIQRELKSDPVVKQLDDNVLVEYEQDAVDDDEIGTTGQPYDEILVDERIDIDTIFKRTCEGKGIMEMLKKGIKPSDRCLTTIKNILCEFLKSNYGLRPSAFYKDLLAVSLVEAYPVLASSNSSVPQALWFHPHARGTNKHSGRLHYHMEYLVRKSGERIINRVKSNICSTEQTDALGETSAISANDIAEIREELKFLCPGPTTKARAEELWLATFNDRQKIRQTEELLNYFKDHSVGSAFNGELITLDFRAIHPECLDFCGKFESVQCQILLQYRDYYMHIQNDFLRTLAIIRLKNPSRGAKRLRDSNAAKENPLQGIVEWFQDDCLPPSKDDVPILQMKGDIFEDNSEGYIVWKDWNMRIDGDLKYCFKVLMECYVVFNTSCRPADKKFILFVSAIMYGVGSLTVTGEKFMRSLK